MIVAVVLIMALAIALFILLMVAAAGWANAKRKHQAEKPKRDTIERLLMDDGEILEVVDAETEVLENVQIETR